ncbi:MAG: hypothetical protein KKF48_00325 [Nanoarchaeota archaeon]|nr:hypothetical protein [Nanoarchaeota archaeon]MBU1027470.1 hypothetical protein [Nanoarchaeota archaeon]
MVKKAQVGIEYMIVISFVTFAVMSVLVIAMFYSDKIKDRIKLNQVESFFTQLLNSAESVFFSGEPSKTSISLFLPAGIGEITIYDEYILVVTSTSSGDNREIFRSDVPIQGTISITEGTKKLVLTAYENYLDISEA